MEATVITVFGNSQPARGSSAYQTAYELGRAIAEAGWTMCNGGYGGTMEAAAKGAVDSGGHTIGVTSRVFADRGGVNAYIRQEVPTFDLLTRLNTLVRLASGFVVLPGGTGTLLELALVWELRNKRLVRDKAPIVLLGDHWAPLNTMIRREQPDVVELTSVPDVPAAIRALRHELEAAGGDENPPLNP